MTRTQALRRVRQFFGAKAAIDVRDTISSPEKRASATEQLRFLRTRRTELDDRIAARQKELLDVPDYQAMLQERADLRRLVDGLQWAASYYRFAAGWANSLFFHIEAQGDTWEEVFEKIEKQRLDAKK